MKEFEPEIVAKKEVTELLNKVKVQPADRFTEQYPKHWGCHVTVIMQDGSRYEAEIKDPSGSLARPLTKEQAMQKAQEFLAVACPGREQEKIREILDLKKRETLPVI